VQHKSHIFTIRTDIFQIENLIFFFVSLDVMNVTFVMQKKKKGSSNSKLSNAYVYSAYDRNPFNQQRHLVQCFSTPGAAAPVPGPGISYTGPLKVLLEVVVLVF